MLWVGSIVRGHEDKLSDEIFWRLTEIGDTLGWELLQKADYAVRTDEWEDIARLVAVADEKVDISWDVWQEERAYVKLYYLRKYLAAMYEASRLIANGQDAEDFLCRFLISPLGLYLCGDSAVANLTVAPLIVVR